MPTEDVHNGPAGSKPDLSQTLRQLAEDQLRASAPPPIEALTPAATERLLHELRVHQIELELQNEELRRAQAALEVSQARYFDLYDLAPVGYVTISAKGLIQEANLTAATLLGVTRGALVKQPLTQCIAREDQDIYYHHRKRLFQTGAPQRCELRLLRSDGGTFWGRLDATLTQAGENGAPVCHVTLSDISEQKQAEAQLQEYAQHLEQRVAEKVAELEREHLKTLHHSRLAALGELATAIAHELRQPLTALTLSGDYLEAVARRWLAAPQGGSAGSPTELLELGQQIRVDVARLRRLVDHLRTFGRTPEKHATPVDLNQTIADSLLLIGEHLRLHCIEVQVHCAANLPLILADTHKLEQVFLNLYSNAEHALAEQAASSTESSTEETSKIQNPKSKISDPYLKVLDIATYARGESVVATVRDNGCGISADVLLRVFEPFFTTKPVSEGTGLGLSICADIVHEFGGEITVASAVGQGTTVTLTFPSMAAESAAPAK